jgi:multidrug efflux pump
LGYSLDNLSLMALTISTGFVVDDVIVVLENVTRHIEAGTPRIRAALQGAREVAFTVLSMSLSLVAVFVPILLMGGIGGRLFREFAVTFSVTIAISSVISLTTTPMMCAYLLPQRREHGHSRLYRAGERAFAMMLDLYDRSLQRALQWPGLVILGLLATLYRCEAFLPEDRLDAVLDQRGGNCRQPIDCAIGWVRGSRPMA